MSDQEIEQKLADQDDQQQRQQQPNDQIVAESTSPTLQEPQQEKKQVEEQNEQKQEEEDHQQKQQQQQHTPEPVVEQQNEEQNQEENSSPQQEERQPETKIEEETTKQPEQQQQQQQRRRQSSVVIHHHQQQEQPKKKKKHHNHEEKEKQFIDASTDSNDLDSFAPEMDVYIPLHISGDGVSRVLTRTSNNNSKNDTRKFSSSHQQQTAKSSRTASRKQSVSAGVGTGMDEEMNVSNNNNNNMEKSQNNSTLNKSTNSNANTNLTGGRKKNVLDGIPENFPIPATCSLSDIHAKLEGLLKSKVFLGFIDNRTGGLVELRDSSLEQFNTVPDQKKVIHCRMLKKEKTRSELMLEASTKKYASQQQQQQNQNQNDTNGDPDVEGKNENNDNQKLNKDLDPETKRILELERKIQKRVAQQKQKELVERLMDDDLKRREIRKKRLEQRMYPTENDNESTNHHPYQKSQQQKTNTTNTKKSKEEMDQILERLNDVEGQKRRKEAKNERIRELMVADGYIVEPDQFRKVSHENTDERNERYYGRGVQWLMRHKEKVSAAQQKEKERKAPKLKSKEEWDSWYEKRGKPLERDKFAAENQPVYVPIGGGAPIDMMAGRNNNKAQTPQPR